MSRETVVFVASQILAEYVRQNLNLNPELIGKALDAGEAVVAEMTRREDERAAAKEAAAKAPAVLVTEPAKLQQLPPV